MVWSRMLSGNCVTFSTRNTRGLERRSKHNQVTQMAIVGPDKVKRAPNKEKIGASRAGNMEEPEVEPERAAAATTDLVSLQQGQIFLRQVPDVVKSSVNAQQALSEGIGPQCQEIPKRVLCQTLSLSNLLRHVVNVHGEQESITGRMSSCLQCRADGVDGELSGSETREASRTSESPGMVASLVVKCVEEARSPSIQQIQMPDGPTEVSRPGRQRSAA